MEGHTLCYDVLEKNVINIIHNNDAQSLETKTILENKLKEKGYIISKTYDYDALLNICIGGDGAFLRTIHKYGFPDTPFIGINTGHLGFFQEILPDKLDHFVENFHQKKYMIEEIYLVEAMVCTRKSCIELVGVNEIVIKAIKSKVIHLNVSINDNYLEKFSGDGLIVSSPIGSTAYNFSAGGSIVYPTLKLMQLTPLSPLNSKAYRSLTNSAIIPDNMTIKVNPENRDENSILIVVDGKEFKYDNIIEVIFKFSNMTLKRLTIDHINFWSNVKDKFL